VNSFINGKHIDKLHFFFLPFTLEKPMQLCLIHFGSPPPHLTQSKLALFVVLQHAKKDVIEENKW
jgi:hypothetical protein